MDVSTNRALTYLRCDSNQLTSLNVSANTALTYLNCGNNRLAGLDVSVNTNLTSLFCNSNQLLNLNISANTDLTRLSCGSNSLTSLDVSANTDLTGLSCTNNQLTRLNVANGNNDRLFINVVRNPNLACIQVDDISSDVLQSWSKDATASYMTSCTTTTTQVLSLNTGWNLVGFNVEPTDNSIANVFAPVGSLVQIKTQSKSYDPSFSGFSTLTSLENGQGYFIRLNRADQITLTGTRITLTEISIPLSAGWNLISYPSENMADIQTALNSISQYLIQIKTQTKSYNPALPVTFNTLRQLEPSKGYFIKVPQNCNLTF